MITNFKQFSMNESNMYNIVKIESYIKKDSVPISNNRVILGQLIEYDMEAYRNNEIGLTNNIIEELTTLFGKHNKGMRLEFLTKLWMLKYKDLIFNVYTAKGKGTSIEICDYEYDAIRMGERQDDILEFLETLYSLINDISLKELELRRSTKGYNL